MKCDRTWRVNYVLLFYLFVFMSVCSFVHSLIIEKLMIMVSKADCRMNEGFGRYYINRPLCCLICSTEKWIVSHLKNSCHRISWDYCHLWSNINEDDILIKLFFNIFRWYLNSLSLTLYVSNIRKTITSHIFFSTFFLCVTLKK